MPTSGGGKSGSATLWGVHARSALFDLYGDHLSDRDGWAPVAGIVRLLGASDITPAAARTAVSRMVREGWLEPAERHGQRGYAASARARSRLTAARTRIYRTGPDDWDGTWHVVVVDHASDRPRRIRVAAALGYLGYARLAPQTWLAPRVSPELAPALAAEDLGSRQFTATYADAGAALASSLWRLAELGAAYRLFLQDTGALRAGLPDRLGPERGYAVRTALVHEWRKFLFRDPGLPAQVLPPDWAGHEAAMLFDTTATSLEPLAREFVDLCLAGDQQVTSPTVRSAVP